ncbi:hypothetical protein PGT21_006617 [Puccinia graminis f. sp. tritici]|uniref:Secreted protein n=1 Tax=Puccinia graminis f. sp. tritici TaxID=56615 RepID=A0A5B0ME07_PUCGR|nr:hypothetical protein PGT21_006617 [Puccinia graminis f. sp. tritici]
MTLLLLWLSRELTAVSLSQINAFHAEQRAAPHAAQAIRSPRPKRQGRPIKIDFTRLQFNCAQLVRAVTIVLSVDKLSAPEKAPNKSTGPCDQFINAAVPPGVGIKEGRL